MIDDLRCRHEEADSSIVWRLRHIRITRNAYNDITTQTIWSLCCRLVANYICMDIVSSGKNTAGYMNVTVLADNLSVDICVAISAFSECNVTVSLLRKEI